MKLERSHSKASDLVGAGACQGYRPYKGKLPGMAFKKLLDHKAFEGVIPMIVCPDMSYGPDFWCSRKTWVLNPIQNRMPTLNMALLFSVLNVTYTIPNDSPNIRSPATLKKNWELGRVLFRLRSTNVECVYSGHPILCDAFPSFLGCGVGGWSYSNFLASTVKPAGFPKSGLVLTR